MKRDMSLIRDMLIAVEDFEGSSSDTIDLETAFPDEDPQRLEYHALLLHEAGYIVSLGKPALYGGLDSFMIVRLTWQGHEFLDAARNESTWTRAMGKVSEIGGNVSISVLKDLLVQTAKDQLGIS